MDDTVAWWHNLEVLKSSLSPLQESKPFGVPGEFHFLILILGIGVTCIINLDTVIDDEIHIAEWVD